MPEAKTGQLTPEEWASLSKTTQTKIKIVNSQRTASLIEQLAKLEEDYQKALNDQTEHKNANATFLCSIGSDCQAVKEFMAGLNPPESGEGGKKTTVAERESWLTKQRKENKDLFVMIERQKTAAFIIESDKNQVAIIENKMSNVRAVLSLRTAQLSFLSGV